MTPQETLAATAKKHQVGLYFNNRKMLDGKPWISIYARSLCLAEFDNIKQALAWFPKF